MSKKKALVLVAHADDETLGCGGTIPRLLKKGWHVDIVIMSDSVVSVRDTPQDNRADAVQACKVLGVDAPRFMGFEDQKFDARPIAELAGAVGELGLEPDLILTHVDSDLNKDHVLTCEVAKIIGRPRRKPVSILGCEIPNTTFWNGRPFAANFYVDISDHLETKIEAFRKYGNELQPYPSPWSKEGLELLAKYHGMQSGVPYAEAFQVIRGYENLMPGSSGGS